MSTSHAIQVTGRHGRTVVGWLETEVAAERWRDDRKGLGNGVVVERRMYAAVCHVQRRQDER